MPMCPIFPVSDAARARANRAEIARARASQEAAHANNSLRWLVTEAELYLEGNLDREQLERTIAECRAYLERRRA